MNDFLNRIANWIAARLIGPVAPADDGLWF